MPPPSFGAENVSTFDTLTDPAADADAGAAVVADADAGLDDAAVWAGGAVAGAAAPTLDGVAEPHAASASSAAATASGTARLGRRALTMGRRYRPAHDFCSRADLRSLCDP